MIGHYIIKGLIVSVINLSIAFSGVHPIPKIKAEKHKIIMHYEKEKTTLQKLQKF